MTVKDIFDLRKQGRIEEAYDAIRPMYAAHKGHYTSLCMFWTASDIFKKRLGEGHIDEATKIFEALKRVLPYIDDRDGKAGAFMQYASRRLSKFRPAAKRPNPVAAVEQPVLQEETKPVALAAVADEHHGTSVPQEIPIEEHSVEDDLDGQPDDSSSEETSELDEDYSGKLIVGLDEGIIRPIEGINVPQRVVLACLTAHPGFSAPQISASTGIPAKSVERHVAALIARNLIEHRGSKKTGGYFTK